ncbi:MAG: hypothetical protein KAV87_27150 [Desulfobacteraceae bacterium]|nr:hypothetical protein [Desulfobacteraceae bacterium]
MKRKVLIGLLLVLGLAFFAQVTTVAQVGPPTPPSHDPSSSSTQGTSNSSTNQQTYIFPSSGELPYPWVLTPWGCQWVEVHDPHGGTFWILICEDWVPTLGPIFIP